MATSRSSETVLCSCGCSKHVSQQTQTQHLQGKGPTLTLAEMFERRSYFGTGHMDDSGIDGLGGDVCPLKQCRIAMPDPRPPPIQSPTQPAPDLDAPSMLNTSAINMDDILASRWMGCNDIGDPDNDVDFEGHPVPQLVEVSGDEDEDSEFDLEDHEVAEDCHRYDFLVRLLEWTYFFELFKLYLHLGLITTPHVFYVHMTYVYSFLMFHPSHDHMAKRSHYRIMIFSTSEYYSTDALPLSFSSISSTTPPPLYSPSMSINDGPTWRRIPPGQAVWSKGRSLK